MTSFHGMTKTTNPNNTMTDTHRCALVSADGVYMGAGWVTFSGAGRTRKIEVEHVDGLGVTKDECATVDFGDASDYANQTIDRHTSIACELRRAGWNVA